MTFPLTEKEWMAQVREVAFPGFPVVVDLSHASQRQGGSVGLPEGLS